MTTTRSYRRLSDEQQVQMQVRLAVGLRDRLLAEADRRAVSVNLLVERAIEQAVTGWEKQRLP